MNFTVIYRDFDNKLSFTFEVPASINSINETRDFLKGANLFGYMFIFYDSEMLLMELL